MIIKTLAISALASLSMFASSNLSMSSAALAADGVTVTIPFTGTCQTPLSPASGILGFTINVTGGWSGSISSATRSGCAVTLISSEPISVNETPTITLASTTGANYLTDASGNTPAGQSGFAVTNNSEWMWANGASTSGKYRAEGSGGIATTYTGQLNLLGADGCYRINATATQLDLFAFNYSNHWVLLQDGARIHDWGVAASGTTFSDQGIVTGLSGAHEYDFCAVSPQNHGFYYASAIRIRVTGTLGAQPAIRSMIAEIGDSLTALYGPTPITDSATGHLSPVAAAFGMADAISGSPGATICAGGNSVQALEQYLNFSGLSTPLAFMAGSSEYNDNSLGTSASALQACWNTLLTAVDALGNPPTHVVVGGQYSFTTSQTAGYDAAIAAAVSAHPRACFVSRLNWVNTTAWNGTTGDRQSDQVHIIGGLLSGPDVGWAKVANREMPIAAGYLSGQSFSVSGGATSGLLNSRSAAFTVTLAGPSTVTFVDPVEVSSYSGDTVCIVGGACGTGSVTLPASWGAHTFQFTVQPSTTGPRTISYAAALPQCWTAPAGATYTAFGNTATFSLQP